MSHDEASAAAYNLKAAWEFHTQNAKNWGGKLCHRIKFYEEQQAWKLGVLVFVLLLFLLYC